MRTKTKSPAAIRQRAADEPRAAHYAWALPAPSVRCAFEKNTKVTAIIISSSSTGTNPDENENPSAS